MDEKEIAEAIVEYLREHPEAMDTMHGIAEWWLMRHQIRTSVTAIANVLSQLKASGVLEEVGAGENRRYRLKPAPPRRPIDASPGR
jgi:hypothetical protein